MIRVVQHVNMFSKPVSHRRVEFNASVPLISQGKTKTSQHDNFQYIDSTPNHKINSMPF